MNRVAESLGVDACATLSFAFRDFACGFGGHYVSRCGNALGTILCKEYHYIKHLCGEIRLYCADVATIEDYCCARCPLCHQLAPTIVARNVTLGRLNILHCAREGRDARPLS